MTVNRTTLLNLPIITTGTESGAWGNITNNGLSQYMDIAIAGTQDLSTDADVTLTSTDGDSSATNIGATTAQYAILRWTATGSTTRNITVPAKSKTYVVINATGGTQSIVLRGAGPTTGVTIIAGEKAHCVWNGSDFVKISSSAVVGSSNTQVQYNNAGVLAGSANLTFDGTTFNAPNSVITSSSSSNALRITQTGSGNALVVEDTSNPDSTPFVIDASGNVVKGSATTLFAPGFATSTALTPGLQSHGTINSSSAVAAFSWQAIASGSPQYILARSRGTSVGTFGVVSSDDNLGGLTFDGDDGTAFIRAASIVAQVDGTPGTNDMPGRLVLSTTPDGSDTPVERIRITSAGKTGFATSAPAATVHVAGDTILSNVNVLGASYDSVSFSVAGQETTPTDLFFSPDGLKMYVIGSVGDDVNEYNLSTAWVVSSAVFVTNFSVASQENAPSGLFFRADGTKMYIVGQTNDTVFQYTLSTPWSIATASYDSISFSVAAEATPNGLFFKPNGLSMYMVGSTGDAVYQYTLSTAWNVSTATFLQSFSVFGQESQPNAVTFTADGSRMFVMGQTGDDVNVYNLTTPWDISTLAFVNVFSVAGQDTTPQGIYIKPDGTKMYILGSTNDTVFQYTVPSIDIQLTGPTSAAALTVQQDLTVYGTTAISGTVTLNGGTANGVAYLNGSKVLTTGSALVFDGSNLGLGVTPSAWGTYKALQVGGAGYGLMGGTSGTVFGSLVTNAYYDGTNWKYVNNAYAQRYDTASGEHRWFNAASGTAGNTITFTQAMTLDASGNLLVGTTSASIGASGRGVIEVNGTSDSVFASKVNGTLAAVSGLASSTEVIYGAVTNVPVVFRTNNTERARIDSSGDLLVGATSIPGAGSATTGSAFGSSGYVSVQRSGATPCYFGRSNDGEVMALYSGTTQRGQVSISGATTTYGSFSDYRLKENVTPVVGGLQKVMALKPSTFNFIEFPNQTINGFIAHEVAEVEPIAVTGEKDGIDDDDGKPAYQSVDPAKLVPLLTAAIQEQQALIASLTARVALLEGN